jgi:hypothetical protein
MVKKEVKNSILEAFPQSKKTNYSILTACYNAQKDVWTSKKWKKFRKTVRWNNDPKKMLEKCREYFSIA